MFEDDDEMNEKIMNNNDDKENCQINKGYVTYELYNKDYIN